MNSSDIPHGEECASNRRGSSPGCFTESRAFITLKRPWECRRAVLTKSNRESRALGFAVGSTRGVVRVEKYGCGAEFRKGPDDLYQMTITPSIMLKGQFTRLWDAGYQKFLLTDEGLKLPALATHLQNDHEMRPLCSANGARS